MCELFGALTGLLLLSRTRPAPVAIEAHLRSLKVGAIGGLAGTVTGRAACRGDEVAALSQSLSR